MKRFFTFKRLALGLVTLALAGAFTTSAPAQDEAAAVAAVADDAEAVAAAAAAVAVDAKFMVDNLWVLLAGCLVFIMHLGFATVESGLTQAKNTVNILFKNSMIICIGLFTYAFCGFALMYPGEFGIISGVLGWAGFGVTKDLADASLMTAAYADYTWYTDFFFQAMFAATAATIVSGAVAERIKLFPFLVFSTVFVAICYPITGSWKWGAGWLDQLGFYDFAGSTLVHSVGGWGALVGAAMVGPRLGKFVRGKVHPIPGHSMPLATIGVFLLWLGWFGFNGGSVLSADPGLISLVCVTTTIAAAAGGVGAMFTSVATSKKPDLSITLNGILAGLVGITAGADQMAVLDAAIIGFIAGIIVVLAVMFFDRIRIDDPVGAISVHLVCGIWGTLAVGLFGAMKGFGQVVNQLIGIGAIGAFTLVFAVVVFGILKATVGIRVDEADEIEGLDTSEHGGMAYPDFVVTQPAGIHPGAAVKAMSQATAGVTIPKSVPTTS